MDIHVYNNHIFMQRSDSNNSVQNLTRGYSQTYICADNVWNKEEKYRILYFEAGSSRGTLQRMCDEVVSSWILTSRQPHWATSGRGCVTNVVTYLAHMLTETLFILRPSSRSMLLYVHRDHKNYWGREPRTTSNLDFHTAPELWNTMAQKFNVALRPQRQKGLLGT